MATGVALAAVSSAALAEDITIAALGDSLTQGYGLIQEDGLVAQLQRWLAENGSGDVQMINAGVSGDTTAGGLARVGWTLSPDTDGLIVALGANDMLRGIDPAVSKANLAGILEAAQTADLPVLLVGIESAGNYGPDYKRDFDAMYPDLAASFDALIYPSLLRPVAAPDAENGPLDPAFMQADGIHPNRDGVAKIVASLGPVVAELADKIRSTQ